MAGLGFHDAGYEYLDKNNNVLFSEDDAHNKLFDYVAADISPISSLLEQLLFIQMNFDTFEPILWNLSDSKSSKIEAILSEIEAILIAAHPYYQYERDKAIIRAIAEYFNQLLIYSIWGCRNFVLEHKVTESWYKDRLSALIPEPLRQKMDDIGPDDFFAGYKEQIGDWNRTDVIEETFVRDVRKPIPFAAELNTQKDIANLLYFVLDEDTEYVRELSTQQRVWLYGNIFRVSNKLPFNVTNRISLSPPSRFYNGIDHSQEIGKVEELKGLSYSLHSLSKINIERHGIPTGLQEQLSSAVKLSEGIVSSELYEIYEIENLWELLFLEVLRMIQSKEMIRKCRNCGRYFKIKDRKKVYCNRITESGQLCSEIGAESTYRKKVEGDEALKLHQRAYKTHHARYRNGILSRGRFVNWCNEAKDKLEKTRRGELDINEFRDWLKK